MPAKKKSQPGKSAPVFIPEKIAPLVHYLRHEKVILDSDLAELYGVPTGRLNEAVKRNLDRFPADFMFQLTEDEAEALRSQAVTLENSQAPLMSQIAISKEAEASLRSQSATLKRGQHRKYLPYAFTEQGVAMLSSVLRSPRAVEVNIAIMRTFVQLRRLMDSNGLVACRSQNPKLRTITLHRRYLPSLDLENERRNYESWILPILKRDESFRVHYLRERDGGENIHLRAIFTDTVLVTGHYGFGGNSEYETTDVTLREHSDLLKLRRDYLDEQARAFDLPCPPLEIHWKSD